MADEAKSIRRTAKARFTRKRNELLKSIDANQGREMVEGNYLKLTEAWDIVEGKHDLYTMFLTDEEQEAAETWILELQELFAEAKAYKIKYIQNVTREENSAREDTIRQESTRKARAEIERMTEKALLKRDTAQAVFETLHSNTTHAIQSDTIAIPSLKRLLTQLEDSFTNCKQTNEMFIDLAEHDKAATAIKWAAEIQCRFNEIIERVSAYIGEKEPKPVAQETHATLNLQLEKIRMPRFEGEIRTYPQFKRDFQRQVMPHLRSDDISYVLRSCLGNEPANTVKSIDDDTTEMWKRLDEKYGDPSKVADVIIDGIRRTRMIRDGEEKRFTEFVEIIEDGYRDLRRLGLEAEITTTSSVSIIEKKLPPDIRRKWAEIVSAENSTVNKSDKFPSLLKFLQNQRGAIEYDNASLRAPLVPSKAVIHHTIAKDETDFKSQRTTQRKCLIHDDAKHSTEDCRVYLSKPISDKIALLREKGACWSCLKSGHRMQSCKTKKTCNIGNCSSQHHKSLHEDERRTSPTPANIASASGPASICSNIEDTCLLQIQRIRTKRGWANVMWDSAASLCFITNNKAKEERLKGTAVNLSIVKIGGQYKTIRTVKYKLSLLDKQGKIVEFEVYGIDKITSDIERINMDGVTHLFNNVAQDELQRPTGPVDVLIGYEYAAYHPVREQCVEHLLLLKNRFGRCVGGTHPLIENSNTRHELHYATVNHSFKVKIDDFYNIENLGVECNPRCGSCKCGKCAIGSKDYTIKEERELALIEKNLSYDKQTNRWIAEYPWIKDPMDLPDNRKVALAMLASTERRLAKTPVHATVYDNQVKDMVNREVARKLSKDEIDNYKGPVHYISHHEVLKPDSKSTPVRIVFNSSANYMGHVLNDYWAKGPDLLNNLLGVLIRFRENEVAFMGDISKMYHTVKTTLIDQHTHRFLWRDMDVSKEPDTYVIQRVSFGDKPSGTIATLALRKTAEMGSQDYPAAAKIIQSNTYMDDIIESTKDLQTAKKLTEDIEKLISKGGFKLKEWILSHSAESREETFVPNEPNVFSEKVLGVIWDPDHDQLRFKTKLNLYLKKKKHRKTQNVTQHVENQNFPPQFTKRMILSQINSIYDPLGLAGPFTVRAKILMRRLWTSNEKLDWDDPIPEENRQQWLIFFNELPEMNHVRFKRCMKPSDAVGDPSLIIFSDASNDAYGSCAYARWPRQGGGFASNLIVSKNRLAPLKTMSIDKIELCGAVLNKRLKSFVDKECRYSFQKCYHIVDSQIVHCMTQKNSYGFNTFAATRIGEIQEGTNVEDWYWCESEHNIADWLTRGKKPSDIDHSSSWQKGPSFLQYPESEWPITRNYSEPQIPKQILKVANIVNASVEDSLAARIDIEKFSEYNRLLRVTARVLKLYERNPRLTFKNATQDLNSKDIERAEIFWIREAQKTMDKHVKDGKYKRLCPRIRSDGIYVISGRGEKWMEMSYSKGDVILLPYQHRLSKLYSRHVHEKGHHGVLTTASKIRSKFWITKLLKLVKSIKLNCIVCKRLDKKLSEQVMGNLPIERLKPAPPWYSTSIDLFGPFTIRDEVKKRTTSKAYGVIFTCLATRAVHLDLAPDYSTEKFLMVLRKFASLRGYPCKIYSDNGPQLVAANRELQSVTKSWEWEQLKNFGVMEGFQWNFTPADAPWQNGASESLIKSVKRALTAIIGESILTFSELQTVFYEVANLVNERPIGRHPTSPDDGSYLCPNDLLLGRSTTRVPSGPFKESTTPKHRFEFIQHIIDGFWKKWTRTYFPDLIVRQKWHTAHRNLNSGDVVLIQDSNLVRGQWRLGIVSRTFPGTDGNVRRVQVKYKNPKPGEPVTKYDGKGYVTVERPVHRLVVLLPKEEHVTF